MSTSTLYGVASVYAASGLFKTTADRRRQQPARLPRRLPLRSRHRPPRRRRRRHRARHRRPRRRRPPRRRRRPLRPRRPTPTPTPTPKITEGIDVSHWQGTIDWTQVAAAGKQFAYIKASESTDFVDPLYVQNRAQARAAGLYVGAYHFAQPSTTAGDAVAEADHFIDVAAPTKGDLLPVLDLERSGGLSSGALTAWVQALHGRDPGSGPASMA